MLATLVICLCLATNLHAGDEHSGTHSSSATSISTSTNAAIDLLLSLKVNATPSSAHFVVKNELAKISTSCLSSRDYERLTGNVVKHGIARMFASTLLSESVLSIGLTELRTALNFAPQRPWAPYNGTTSSERELASASSIEAYYNLTEPRSSMQSLDSVYLLEQNVDAAIAYLDKRLPEIRIIFKRRFEEMHRIDAGPIDKQAIDRWIEELLAIHDKIDNAITQMRRNDSRCWD